ncbi:eCIS core domain-containing protein [Streptomyces tauricus]|uniref:eCIS core domain-containing protein n=1 Tax=Streptomyces tauricus TaxID=68274 RepID=UPI00167B853A|nr:DUF4157 domain-containing protein [Streptomyces tauricus]MCW8100756.1 DUF4157 domain-containing protein [Streptomyces tauricus]
MRAQEAQAEKAGGDQVKVRPNTTDRDATADRILALQSAAGNAAVTQAVQRRQHQHSDGCGHTPDEQRELVDQVRKSPGTRMNGSLLKETASWFGGEDFSTVKLHTDSVALQSAKAIGARAYTAGDDVVWDGRDKPTLIHELQHVKDQRMGAVPGTDNGSGLKVSSRGDWGEKRAEAIEAQARSGPPPVQRAADSEAVTSGHGFDGAAVQRAPAESVQRASGPTVQRADGPVVQRALDPEVIKGAQEKLGVEGTVKIVEVPDSGSIRADTPFANYPPGSCVGLSEEELQLSVQALNGGEGHHAASAVVGLAGGGAYIASHKILLVNSTPSPGFTVEQTVRHEMGHVQQDQAGFSVDMSGGRRALVEYHNMLVNENQFAEGNPRHEYNSTDNSLPSAVREAMVGAGLAPAKPWETLVEYINSNDPDGTQKQLLNAIVEELNKEEYSVEQGGKFNRATIRKKIQDRIGRFYFTQLFK